MLLTVRGDCGKASGGDLVEEGEKLLLLSLGSGGLEGEHRWGSLEFKV